MSKQNKNHHPGDGSTGPRTLAGKTASSRNGTSHGARSESHVILPTESSKAYEHVRERWSEEYPPSSDLEEHLLDRVAQREWHLLRCDRLHEEAFTRALLNNPDPSQWSDAEIKHINLMLRYRNTADRAWRAAVKDVKDLRKCRLDMLHLAEKLRRSRYNNFKDGLIKPRADRNPDDKANEDEAFAVIYPDKENSPRRE